VTRVGGKPFFARGLYHVDPKDYSLVKKQGFNIVQAAPANVPKCEAAGLKAAVMLYGGMRIKRDYYRQQIMAYKDNPAVACWMIMDEPDGNRTPLEEVQGAYTLIRSLDPERPAYMCLCQPSAYASYGLATDIIAIDVYPVHAGKDDIEPIGTALDVAHRDVPQQVVWFIGQVWSWPGHKDSSQRRLVTAAEHRAMTYLSLTHDNVRGLMWYSFRDPQWYLPESNPEAWRACRRVNEELATLEPVLLHSNQAEQVVAGSDGGQVHAAVKEHEGSRYVIAVNGGYRATTARISVGAGTAAEVLFEGRTAAIAGDVLSDRFEPLAVHVYKITRRGGKP
jgi:hypothetical protein